MDNGLDLNPLWLRVGDKLPNAEIVTVTSPRPFFRGELDVDALLLSAEEAAAWTLVYPEYSVAVPFPDWKAPVVCAMDVSDSSLHGYVELGGRDQPVHSEGETSERRAEGALEVFEGDRFVVLVLRGRGEDRLGQARRLLEAGGQGDSADRAVRTVGFPSRARDVAADHALNGHDVRLSNQHRSPV